MTAVLVSTIAVVGLVGVAANDEEAADPKRPTLPLSVSKTTITTPACDRPALNRAITFYRQAYRSSRERMRAEGPVARVWYRNCTTLERRSVDWRARAAEARWLSDAWVQWHYDWPAWLPDKWQRIGACETGYGQRPGNWRHNSGAYQGAFGFAVSSWDGFVPSADPDAGPYPPNADEATPRQQYEVALAIYRRYGLSGWGCRGA